MMLDAVSDTKILICRGEDPLGNWTLSVYDVDHPKYTGFMLNWTLTLFGEQDPDFLGTPVHFSSGIHQDEEHELPIPATSTHTTVSDSTPPRPTPIKVTKTTSSKTTTTTTRKSSSRSTTTSTTTVVTSMTTKASTTEEASITAEAESTPSTQSDTTNEDHPPDNSSGYLTIVYSVLGSVAIFGVASALFFYKKRGWQSASVSDTFTSDRRPDGYEFDVLQPLTELDEEESEDEDTTRLVHH